MGSCHHPSSLPQIHKTFPTGSCFWKSQTAPEQLTQTPQPRCPGVRDSEGLSISPAPQNLPTGALQCSAQLPALPPTPLGLTLRVHADGVVLPAGEAEPGLGGVLEGRQVLRGEAGLGALGACGVGRTNPGTSGTILSPHSQPSSPSPSAEGLSISAQIHGLRAGN